MAGEVDEEEEGISSSEVDIAIALSRAPMLSLRLGGCDQRSKGD